jgi:Amt family ammonium transporter
VICYNAIKLKSKLGYDDTLDVFGVHGVGGIWGALATGLFADTAINSAGKDGLFFGNPEQLWIQFVAAAAAAGFSIVVTAVILKAIDLTIGLRVPEQDEVLGLDTSQHGELAYRV